MTYQSHYTKSCYYCGARIYFDTNNRNNDGRCFPLDHPSGLRHNCREYHALDDSNKRSRRQSKISTRRITEYKNDGGIIVIEEKEETPIIERRLNED